MTPSEHNIKKQYGSFVLAAAAYVIGVLLFLLWSYFAQRNSLLDYVDKSLIDTVFATQEILEADDISSLSSDSHTNSSSYAEKKLRLTRMARNGNFSCIGVASVINRDVKMLIHGSGSTNGMRAAQNGIAPPLSPGIQAELLRLAEGGHNDVSLRSVSHPTHDILRLAVLYRAEEPNQGIAVIVSQENSFIEQELGGQRLRLIVAGIGMLLLAVPLITLFGRTQKKAAVELADMNTLLQQDVELQKSREEDLKDAISDLERFNAVSAGREMRIIQLKAEVNELLQQMKRQKRYNIDKID